MNSTLLFLFLFSTGEDAVTYLHNTAVTKTSFKIAKTYKSINTAILKKKKKGLENKTPVSKLNVYFLSAQKADSWHSHIFHMERRDTRPWDR